MSDKNIQNTDMETLNEKETEAYLLAVEKYTPDLWNRISREFDKEIKNNKEKTRKNKIKIIKKCSFAAAAVIFAVILARPLYTDKKTSDKDVSDSISIKSDDTADLQTKEADDKSETVKEPNETADMEQAENFQEDSINYEPEDNIMEDECMFDAEPAEKNDSDAVWAVKKIDYATSYEQGELSGEKTERFELLFDNLNLMPQDENTKVASEYDITYTIVYEAGSESEIKLKKTGEVSIDGLKCIGNEDIVNQLIELYIE